MKISTSKHAEEGIPTVNSEMLNYGKPRRIKLEEYIFSLLCIVICCYDKIIMTTDIECYHNY